MSYVLTFLGVLVNGQRVDDGDENDEDGGGRRQGDAASPHAVRMDCLLASEVKVLLIHLIMRKYCTLLPN